MQLSPSKHFNNYNNNWSLQVNIWVNIKKRLMPSPYNVLMLIFTQLKSCTHEFHSCLMYTWQYTPWIVKCVISISINTDINICQRQFPNWSQFMVSTKYYKLTKSTSSKVISVHLLWMGTMSMMWHTNHSFVWDILYCLLLSSGRCAMILICYLQMLSLNLKLWA